MYIIWVNCKSLNLVVGSKIHLIFWGSSSNYKMTTDDWQMLCSNGKTRLNQIFDFLIIEEQILLAVLLWEINAGEKCFCSFWFLVWVSSILRLMVNTMHLIFLILILCIYFVFVILLCQFLIHHILKSRKGM